MVEEGKGKVEDPVLEPMKKLNVFKHLLARDEVRSILGKESEWSKSS